MAGAARGRLCPVHRVHLARRLAIARQHGSHSRHIESTEFQELGGGDLRSSATAACRADSRRAPAVCRGDLRARGGNAVSERRNSDRCCSRIVFRNCEARRFVRRRVDRRIAARAHAPLTYARHAVGQRRRCESPAASLPARRTRTAGNRRTLEKSDRRNAHLIVSGDCRDPSDRFRGSGKHFSRPRRRRSIAGHRWLDHDGSVCLRRTAGGAQRFAPRSVSARPGEDVSADCRIAARRGTGRAAFGRIVVRDSHAPRQLPHPQPRRRACVVPHIAGVHGLCARLRRPDFRDSTADSKRGDDSFPRLEHGRRLSARPHRSRSTDASDDRKRNYASDRDVSCGSRPDRLDVRDDKACQRRSGDDPDRDNSCGGSARWRDRDWPPPSRGAVR